MRIAVLHRYPAAEVIGTNASFLAFLENLKKQKHEVFYLTYKSSLFQEKIPGIIYRELPFTFNRGNRKDKLIKTLLWIVLAPLKALQLKKQDNIDLFYCDDSVPYYGFLTKILVGRTKVIIRLGDLQSGYNFADQGFIKGILFKIFLGLEIFMWRRLDGLIAISRPFAEFIEKQGIKKTQIKLVEESINLDQFKKVNKENKNNQKFKGSPRIMFHGALLPCKGLTTFIKAVPIVLKKIPSAIFIIAGGGSEEKKLKMIAKQYINKGQIIFTGWYNHKNLNRFLSQADIGVVMRSSNMANNFVVTTCLLEYWAAQKPVIIPNLQAMKGVVKNGFNGLFFNPDNEKDLAEQIIYLSQNQNLWQELGKNGWKTAKKYFDKDLIAKKMTAMIKELITEK